MAFCGDYGYGAGACGDYGFAGACAPAACAPVMEHCAPAPVVCAPAPVAAHHSTVEAWGRPVYKKKWLFGKWKYAGMSDVKYVPRTHMDSFAAAPVCAPTVGCAPGYGGYGAGYGCY